MKYRWVIGLKTNPVCSKKRIRKYFVFNFLTHGNFIWSCNENNPQKIVHILCLLSLSNKLHLKLNNALKYNKDSRTILISNIQLENPLLTNLLPFWMRFSDLESKQEHDQNSCMRDLMHWNLETFSSEI